MLVGACSHVLCGLGGVGKTQIAAEHARRLWEAGDVEVVLWVNGSSADEIRSAYAVAAAADPGPVRARKAGQSTQRMAQIWLDWLTSTTTRWLVVIDDVQTATDLNGLWPPHTPTGQVVVTSRRREFEFDGEGRHLIPVALFTACESLDFLNRRLAFCPARADGAAELAQQLHHLPLALAQAAAYILKRPSMTCRTYLRRFTDRRTRLRELLPAPGELPDEHRDTLATIWDLSIEQANSMIPTGLATPLLDIACLLEANGIPEALFTTPAVLNHLRAHTDSDVTADTALDALACLHSLHLITHDGDSTPRWIRIHALVQRAIREALPTEGLATAATVAADALLQIWPVADRDPHTAAAALRSNATTLIAHTEASLWNSHCHPLLLRYNLSLGQSGQLHTAIGHARRLLDTALTQLGTEHLSTFAIRARLAHWRGEADDPVGAALSLQLLLKDRTTVLGPHHPDTLATRHNLANRRGTAGDHAGAAADFAWLLRDRIRALGTDHPHTLSTVNNLAYWQEEAGELDSAISTFTKLLRTRERVLGEDHPDTLTALRNLAYAQREAGQYHHAVTTHQRLLTRLVNTGVARDSEIVEIRSDLASCLAQTGDHATAAAGFARLLQDIEPLLGPDHPDTLTTRHNLALCRGHAGDLTTALAELTQLLILMQQAPGPKHPDCLTVRANLAEFLGLTGDRARAIALLQPLAEDTQSVFGRGHPLVLATRSNLAHWQASSGAVTEAIATLQHALDDTVGALGPEHPSTLTTRYNLAHWLAESGAHPAAAAILGDVLRRQEVALGTGHPMTEVSRARLAQIPRGPQDDTPEQRSCSTAS
ncbi:MULTISPECIES: tetratricopeptide repeat protein [unclassified Crossiella]|uniref:tetratricopeptide repeat protein n=1 Tax=unclassified Crossiella TaxID=2620835 RepID=UPI001FFEB7BE|nr:MULTISPECIES: tetratricopeptide repeat protein [unclassified Crossiella]MCK2243656.1 tetratricopeptide repeat protein [Crossiella sp. S99.2]MCK2257514.1 tetratricopeptide repeat protein [Crossiella sp. S99.1]